MRANGRVALAAVALATLLSVPVVAAWRGRASAAGAGRLPVRRAPNVIPAAVRRLVWRPVAGDAPTRLTDFTFLGDTLVTLDARDQRVRLLRLDGGTWRVLAAWGRQGGGPGEFQRPAALARVDAGHLAVLDGPGRIQLFDPTGRLVGAERAAAPCQMAVPVLAYGDDTRWLAGNCAPGGPARDTIFAMLYAAAGDGEYREVARYPRMSLNLSWGSAFATQQPLVDEREAIYFGTGLDDCVYVAPRHAGATPRVEHRCGLALERLRAPEPASVKRQRREAERRGQHNLARLMRWPDALPPYMGLVQGPSGLLLARPIGDEELVVVPAGQPFDAAHALLAAPLVSFVACKRGTCLWYDESGRIATFRPGDAAPTAGGSRGDAEARGREKARTAERPVASDQLEATSRERTTQRPSGAPGHAPARRKVSARFAHGSQLVGWPLATGSSAVAVPPPRPSRRPRPSRLVSPR